MRFCSAGLALCCLLLSACDSAIPPEELLVGSWVVDSTGFVTTVVPSADRTVVDFSRSITGSVVVAGAVDATLDHASVVFAYDDSRRLAEFWKDEVDGSNPSTVQRRWMSAMAQPFGKSPSYKFVARSGFHVSTYTNSRDGGPIRVDGARITVPAVELKNNLDWELPPANILEGNFRFATLEFVAGRSVIVERRFQASNSGEFKRRYVFGADGTYRVESFAQTDEESTTVQSSGIWEIEGSELTLRTTQGGPARTESFRYRLEGRRLMLSVAESTCSTNDSCIYAQEAALSFPPGSISSYESARAITLGR